MASADFDKPLKTAIRERRLVAFILDERPRAFLRTLNFYVPPAYDNDGDELPPAKR